MTLLLVVLGAELGVVLVPLTSKRALTNEMFSNKESSFMYLSSQKSGREG